MQSKKVKLPLNFNVLIDDKIFEDLISSKNKESRVNDKNRLCSIVNKFNNDVWWEEKFVEFVLNSLTSAALTKRERENLEIFSQLKQSALNLFNSTWKLEKKKDENSTCEEDGKVKHNIEGEIGEIVLYGILEKHYSALPIVPKIYFKQSSETNVKGADSVHIVINKEEKSFSLWLGEAKFYNSLKQGLRSALNSVENFLKNEKQIRKENFFITGSEDLDDYIEDRQLVEQIREKLSLDQPLDEVYGCLHVPILILYECTITQKARALNEEYKEQIKHNQITEANSFFEGKKLKLTV